MRVAALSVFELLRARPGNETGFEFPSVDCSDGVSFRALEGYRFAARRESGWVLIQVAFPVGGVHCSADLYVAAAGSPTAIYRVGAKLTCGEWRDGTWSLSWQDPRRWSAAIIGEVREQAGCRTFEVRGVEFRLAHDRLAGPDAKVLLKLGYPRTIVRPPGNDGEWFAIGI